jgi:hypothetical protein
MDYDSQWNGTKSLLVMTPDTGYGGPEGVSRVGLSGVAPPPLPFGESLPSIVHSHPLVMMKANNC